jgi:ligand-binding sensor domain-containing protein
MISKYALTFFTFILFSCNAQNKADSILNTTTHPSNEQQATNAFISENGFCCGYLDCEGLLWIGSRGNGVFRYDGTSVTNLTQVDGLCDNDISCVTEDREGNLLFGGTNGICRFDGENFSYQAIPQSDTSSVWLDRVYPIVNPNQVMSILEDKQGDLWIGTNGAGVYRYDGKFFSQFLSDVGKAYEDGLQHNIVLSIVEDLSGNIWFSSLSHGGVSRYDGESFTHYINELSDDFIRTVFCDKKGHIWIGTHGSHDGGLDRFDGIEFTQYHKTDDGFSHNNVRSIFEDKEGTLWLGSGTTELSVFDGEMFKVFTAADGQTFDKITFVVGDKEDNIWFGNNDGLWRFDGELVRDMTQNQDD